MHHKDLKANPSYLLFDTIPAKEFLDTLPLKEILNLRLINKSTKEVIDNYLLEALKIKQVACGQNHTIILLAGGRVLVMGSNAQGQLGLGIDIPKMESPTELIGIGKIKKVVAGDFYTLLLHEENYVLGMGHNRSKQIRKIKKKPTIYIPEKISSLKNITDISAHHTSSIFLNGENELFKRGAYDGGETYLLNNEIKFLPFWIKPYFDNQKDIKDIVVDGNDALVLKNNGKLYKICSARPSSEEVILTDKKIKKFHITSHNIFVITDENQLYVSGNMNTYGQLGKLSDTKIENFTLVKDINNINFIAVSDYHTCIVTNDHQSNVMGCNEYGQLGIEVPNHQASQFSFLLSRGEPTKNTSQPVNHYQPMQGFFKLKNKLQEKEKEQADSFVIVIKP